MKAQAKYSVIIPVFKLEGNPYLSSILKALSEQTLPPYEVHLVVGDNRQGRAINYGVSQIHTEYIATVDDDTQIDDSKLFEKLITAIDEDPDIGICGAACEIPDYASAFQKRAMRQIPRRYFPVTKLTCQSDMVQHPCLIMRRDLFLQIGGEDEELIRGLDPVLRKKVRDTGKKCVIVKDTWVYHLIPDSFFKLLKMYYRNGRGSGYASRNYPERVLELSDGNDNGTFVEKKPLIYRIFRRILGVFTALLTFKILKLFTDLAYIYGVIQEKFIPSYVGISNVEEITTEIDESYKTFKLYIHKVKLSN
jgi:GT2 family glycosyltransferase